jgi:hypothetical protein
MDEGTESTQRRLDQIPDRQTILDKLAQTRKRAEYPEALELAEQYLEQHPDDKEVKQALEDFEDHTDWHMFLWTYLPSFVIAYLLIGYFSDRWGIAVVAAMVVAVPGMVLVGFITMPLASRTRWTKE